MNDEDLRIVRIVAQIDEVLEAFYKFPKWMTDQQIIEYFKEEGANGEFEKVEESWHWQDVIEVDEIDLNSHSVWTPNFELIEERFGKPNEEELEEQAEHKLQNMSIDEFQNCLEDISGTASYVFDGYYNEVKEALVKQLAESYEMAREISSETASAINMAEDTLRREP